MENQKIQLTRHDGAIIQISEKGVQIGRSRNNDLVISDPGVSRLHARIYYSSGQYWLRDENSAGGVMLNSRKLHGQAALKMGDVIHIGGTSLRVDPAQSRAINAGSGRGENTVPILVVVGGLLIVGVLALSMSGGSDLRAPAGISRSEVTNTVQQSPTQEIPNTNPPASVTELVTSRQGARDAVIQIYATGNFMEFSTWESVSGGYGSGFIIDSSGLAVTNNHVISGANRLEIYIGGDESSSYSAKIVGYDECSDLAVIDIEGEGFSSLSWYKSPITLELPVYAAGFPLGEPQYTITSGTISRESSNGDTPNSSLPYTIMHTSDITSGNSGGPLLSENGEVVGVNYAGRILDNQYFAISSDVAQPIVNILKTGVAQDSIGINGEAFATQVDGEPLSGVWVSGVTKGSIADLLGLKAGDIIFELDGSDVGTDGTMVDYCEIIRSHNLSSDVIPIYIYRFDTDAVYFGEINGQKLTLYLD
jgi:S1-C subfamily serine protease